MHYREMAARGVESSRTGCEIPEEVFTILSSLNVCKFTKPVWNLYKTGKGYGLKLFWKTDGLVANPINAHSNPTQSRKRRSRRRLEEFLRRKNEERRTGETENRSTTLTVEGPMRHSKPQLEGVNDRRLNQARKDPEAEMSSAALATQEATTCNPQSVLQVTTSQLVHAPSNHILENSGLDVQESHPPVLPLILTPTNQTDCHQRDHVCSTPFCVAEDSTSRCEHTVREPPTDTDLQEVLEGADNIFYEAKEDIPGVRFQKHGKENWVPVRAALDSIHKDDIHYLKGCRSVRFFRSADGTPSLSLHRGKCRFPTPIALRTRARSRHDT